MAAVLLRLAALLAAVGAAAPLQEFAPFPAPTQRLPTEELLRTYAAWHAAQMAEDVDCRTRRFYVFRPNAGLGDSFGAFAAAVRYAMETQRLLMVDWPKNWDDSLSPPDGIQWIWRNAVADGSACETWTGYALHQHGHPTLQTKPETLQTVPMNQREVQKLILRPSPPVAELMAAAEARLAGAETRVCLQMRFGMTRGGRPEMQFLAPGDQHRFVHCAKRLAETKPIKGKWAVFLTTDTPEAAEDVIKNLNVPVVQIEGKVAHVFREPASADIMKAFADFFMLGRCDELFVTAWSLFSQYGQVVFETQKPRGRRPYEISHGNCGDGGNVKKCAQYSKYPSFCDGHLDA
eukprot:TRINITY_DN2397_c0_g1_i1.p1 TRINITY_DN2397_c0_g1~~TRINITY_DN2397_c0_g1_i1.p1  ORF type:complete len:356 (-),score=105.39 TRINITY_DN2397_c0_g1_i1:11-1054(-)